MNRLDAIKKQCEDEKGNPRYVGLFPEDVKDDLIESLRGCEIAEHSSNEEEWQDVGDNGFGIEIKNPHPGGEAILLDIGGEFSIFFGEWHAHGASCLDDYEEWFKPTIKKLLENKECALCLVDGNGRWLLSTLSDEPLSRDCAPEKIMSILDLSENFRQDVERLGGTVTVQYFDPRLSFEIRIPPAS